VAHQDAFVLRDSGLNAFLHADVGTEQNGSTLTVLSILARLGKDPWAQAAEWAKLSNAAMIDGLSRCIEQMPLSPRALAEARVTAKNLVMLLPSQIVINRQVASHMVTGMKAPAWLPMVIFCIILCLVIGAGTFAVAPAPPAPGTQMFDHTQ
jgi:hypothetical protein